MPAFDLDAELETLAKAFAARGIDYALCGGLALAVHGHPRATKDIDVLVRGESVDAARRVAHALGFDIEAMPMTFASGIEVRRVSKVESDRLLSIDLIVVEPMLEGPWSSKQSVTWRGGPLAVVSRAGLVEMKRLAGRPQDLADLFQLGEADGT